jgi:uncharacterized Tic20 family protein
VFYWKGEIMTEQVSTSAPPQNDKIMAALAHISAILPMMGVIAPIIIWATQKDKSEYVAFQALQAIVYQLVMIFAWFIGMGCYVLSFIFTFLTIPFASGGGGDPNSPFFIVGFMFPFLIFGGIFIGGAIFILYGIVGAVMAFQGKEFRYALIGNQLAKYMEQAS